MGAATVAHRRLIVAAVVVVWWPWKLNVIIIMFDVIYTFGVL